MLTPKYFLEKFNIANDLPANKLPVELPNCGRFQLVEWLKDYGFTVGVEIGVAAGEYSAAIARANPQMQIYGIDPYEGYSGYRDYVRKSSFNNLEIKAHRLLREFPNYHFIRKFSVDAAKDFANNSVDFVYIDGNHVDPYVSQDIEAWYPKLKQGGIMAGHDYARVKAMDGTPRSCDVKDAVNRFAKNNNIEPWFLLGAEATDQGLIRDKPRSWMYVK